MVLNNYSYCIFLTKRLLIRIFNRNCNNWERISISKKDYKRCRSNGTIIIDGPKERINLNANGLSTQKRMIEIRGRMRSCVCLSTIQLQFLFFFEMVDERVFRKAQKSVVVKLAWSNIIDGICSINVDTLFGSWFTDLTPFRLVRFSSRHPFRIAISKYSNTRCTRPRDFTTSRHTQREMHNGIDLSYCYKRIASPIDKLINELLERRAYYCRCPRLKLVIAISDAVFRSG